MSVKNVTEFRNIGMAGISGIGSPSIPKAVGNTFAGNLTFQYQGPGGSFDVGMGFSPAASLFGLPIGTHKPVTHFFLTTTTLPIASTWTSKTLTVGGIIPTDMAPGLKDILKWIQTAGGPRDPGGNGYKLSNWDDDVYEITSVQQFQSLTAIYA